ncbi:hypothetical protein DDE82_007297 [Stemphylium lycopersici]|nr:hypothetical protein DDE82_007297 [Stemphylium lycopersici]
MVPPSLDLPRSRALSFSLTRKFRCILVQGADIMIALWPRQTTVTMIMPVTLRRCTGPKSADKNLYPWYLGYVNFGDEHQGTYQMFHQPSFVERLSFRAFGELEPELFFLSARDVAGQGEAGKGTNYNAGPAHAQAMPDRCLPKRLHSASQLQVAASKGAWVGQTKRARVFLFRYPRSIEKESDDAYKRSGNRREKSMFNEQKKSPILFSYALVRKKWQGHPPRRRLRRRRTDRYNRASLPPPPPNQQPMPMPTQVRPAVEWLNVVGGCGGARGCLARVEMWIDRFVKVAGGIYGTGGSEHFAMVAKEMKKAGGYRDL